MSIHTVAAALSRATAVFERRPDMALHDDAPAAARWQGGMRVIARHANGTAVPTDMPGELGGSGDQVSPGWLFRAGIAACAATSIAMAAAAAGVELSLLEVDVHSRSDSRGLLGMQDADGGLVYAGPRDMRLAVRIAAAGVASERLEALVAHGLRSSPIPSAVTHATPLAVTVEVGSHGGPHVD